MSEMSLHLPDDLSRAVESAAARENISESEVIRRALGWTVGRPRPRPTGALFSGGKPIARNLDRLLGGFGER